ncbi:MAG TPA: UDP-N-acetylmuramoyl-L-alanine--D-glutamate ligase [Candidatus Nanopelagicales bacterium]|nr:UDP-N-acetylmuramoyl-L-alanine--D-glutamate ligase [Candidatus Nanopelagicales bacterium]
MTRTDVSAYARGSDWSAVHAVVAGIGVAGFAAADQLVHLGARVTVIDSADGDKQRERADVLQVVGATVRLGDGDSLPDGADVLVVSPGLPPRAPVTLAAQEQGVPVWGELELAWRLRGEGAAPWLVVTGTNGKTTTTLMLASMLRAAGHRTAAVGNIGVSLVDAVMDPVGFDVLAVEVGAPQLPFLSTASPLASVCLNVAEDHIDLFGSFDDYRAAKARIYRNTQVAAVYDVAEPETLAMVEEADVVEGCRAIGITRGIPGLSMLGVVDDLLVDRAFVENRQEAAQELASVHDVRPFAPHNVTNALAAAALARAFGVPASAVREGLRTFEPAGHRIAEVGEVDGVRYVDDSKATNCHAAETSLLAYEPVVWIAGGMAKGQEFDDLVVRTRDRLRGAVLLGVDRDRIREALARHAPDVPVVEVSRTDTGAMDDVVSAAAGLARPGDTVLLAPGCASWDMYRDYAQRGDDFADSVRRLADR